MSRLVLMANPPLGGGAITAQLCVRLHSTLVLGLYCGAADDAGHSRLQLECASDDRSAVDKITQAAAANGGKADVNPKQDLPFMYSRSFEDVDGHVWEPLFFDMSQFPKG